MLIWVHHWIKYGGSRSRLQRSRDLGVSRVACTITVTQPWNAAHTRLALIAYQTSPLWRSINNTTHVRVVLVEESVDAVTKSPLIDADRGPHHARRRSSFQRTDYRQSRVKRVSCTQRKQLPLSICVHNVHFNVDHFWRFALISLFW